MAGMPPWKHQPRSGLHVQQHDSACIFERRIAQPCARHTVPNLPGMHPSHKLESMGFAFICIQCKSSALVLASWPRFLVNFVCPHPRVQ